ncbi:MAG: ribosomal-processing cysteine protease Prp [Clostridia bacterium]|nr:ribosomal-processing cysteine protease Prp [Clostridia bacterium]
MTTAEFWNYGFRISGHSTENARDDEGRKLCAAVSSAAYMAANTVTEIIGDKAEIKVSDGEMFFETENPSDKTAAVIKGLKLHLTELSKEYGKQLKVISEV